MKDLEVKLQRAEEIVESHRIEVDRLQREAMSYDAARARAEELAQTAHAELHECQARLAAERNVRPIDVHLFIFLCLRLLCGAGSRHR